MTEAGTPGGSAPAHARTGVRTIGLGPMQRMAAARLSRSHAETAAVTLLGEAEVEALVALRERLNAEAAASGGAPIRFTALLVKVVAQALRAHPALNATFEDGALHVHEAVHLGVALSLPDDNLIVPVVRDAHRASLREVAATLADLAVSARAGRLALDDVRGATFTLTNAGVVRSARWSTPIIALPQCAILGVGALRQAPWVRAGHVVPAWVVPTSLSFDHRAVNGVPAQRFIDTLHALLSSPADVDFGL